MAEQDWTEGQEIVKVVAVQEMLGGGMTLAKAKEINGACCWWYFDEVLGMSEMPRPLPAWSLEGVML